MEKPNWILQRTRISSDKTALIDLHTNHTWTYGQLEKTMRKWISFMQKSGLKKGDRLAVLATNRMNLFPIIFACGVMGIIYVPLNYRLSYKEIGVLVQDADPAVLLYDETCFSLIENLSVEKVSVNIIHSYSENALPIVTVCDEDPWFIIYTGGTTGKPKGVVLSHRAVNANAINTIISWGLSEADKTINYMPLFHTGGINALCMPLLMAGGTVVIGQQFDGEEALRATNLYEATISLFVPTMYHLMTQTAYFHQSKFDSMRVFLSGAAPCPARIYARFHEKNIPFKEGYGLTEAGPNNFFIRPELATVKRGSVGKNMLFNEVKVVCADGESCDTNEIGELLLKGEHVFTEYWNRNKETEATFVDGWLKTGDLAKYDEDGDYYIVGRKKDMIISGGENIYPQEIEQCLLQHQAVSEVAVVGIPDDKWGEVTVAFLSTYKNESVDVEDVKEQCKHFLGKYKVPKQFIVVEELPKTDVGKMDKSKLVGLAKVKVGK